MESILGKILESAAMCAATGSDPETESKKCVAEIMKDLFEEDKAQQNLEDCAKELSGFIASMPMCVKAEHKAEWDRNKLNIQITGHSAAIRVGIELLLEAVALEIAKKEDREPEEAIGEICGHVIGELIRGHKNA